MRITSAPGSINTTSCSTRLGSGSCQCSRIAARRFPPRSSYRPPHGLGHRKSLRGCEGDAVAFLIPPGLGRVPRESHFCITVSYICRADARKPRQSRWNCTSPLAPQSASPPSPALSICEVGSAPSQAKPSGAPSLQLHLHPVRPAIERHSRRRIAEHIVRVAVQPPH